MDNDVVEPSSPKEGAVQKTRQPFASPAKPKLKSRASNAFRAASAVAGTSTQQQFETQPAKRSVLKPKAGACCTGQPTSTPKKQSILPFTSPLGKGAQSPGVRPKQNAGLARARAATAVAPSRTQDRYVVQPTKGTAKNVAIDILSSGEDATSSSDSDEDVPLIPMPAGTAAAANAGAAQPAKKSPVDLTGDTSDSGQANGNSDADMSCDEAAENPPVVGPPPDNGGGAGAGVVFSVSSSDDENGAQNQPQVGGVLSSCGQPANDAADGDTGARQKKPGGAAGQKKDPISSSGQGDAVVQDSLQELPDSGAVLDTVGGENALPVAVPSAHVGSRGASTSKRLDVSPPVSKARRIEDAAQQHPHHDREVSQHPDADEKMHEMDARTDSARGAIEDAPREPVTEYVQDDDDRPLKSNVLAQIAEALTGGPGPSLAFSPPEPKVEPKGYVCTSNPPKGARAKKEKEKKEKEQKKKFKHPHAAAKHDKKGPILFHHISRQPLTTGLAATDDLRRRIDREDSPMWQYWVTSLRQRMRQYSMPQEEAHYIFRFEHYRFWLPHSSSALWPSIVEGFILRYREWIRDDPVVREVCHKHLLHLTRLRLLAPMQTQHCLKVLNGTVTPCPDYMFDHLRPADPHPHVEEEDDREDEELAEAERREEEIAVARLAALQKAAAGSHAVVGRKRPAPGAPPSQLFHKPEPGCSDTHPAELERMLGSVPTENMSLRVKRELLKLDSTLANQPCNMHAGASTSAPTKQKLKLKIKQKPPPVLFRYVSPSDYPKAVKQQIRKRRVRKLSQCIV